MKKITDLLFELGQLKRVKRSGWWLINIKDPESVADHSFRTAAIGYFLAKMEKTDYKKVILAGLFNDIHETRINDLHKLGHRYIDFKKAENKVFEEQMKNIPDEISNELIQVHNEFQDQVSMDGIIAIDVVLIVCALQAKEYIKLGYKDAQDWIINISKIIKTDSAKKLLKEIENTDPNEWWQGLKKID